MRKPPSANPPSARAQLGQILLWLSDEIIQSTNESLKKKNISLSKFAILLLFLREDLPDNALAPSAIAERLRITRASVTNHLNWLEQEGLIQRTKPSNDQRHVEVHVTKNGHALLRSVLPAFWKVFAYFSKALSDKEVQIAFKLLEKIHASVE